MNTPKEVAQNYIATGVTKTKYTVGKMLLLGILAGMFIALACAGTTVASSTITNPSVAKIVTALLFPAGLAMTLVSGSELFTGNCLIIISVLEKEAKVSSMLRNWLFVYIGNFIGGLLVAALVVYGHTPSVLADNAVAISTIKTAVTKTSLTFGDALFRGILCNFLVCIAVWMSFAAKDIAGKIIAVFFPIMLFVVTGFEHSVANMYSISAGLFATNNSTYTAAFGGDYSGLTWGTMFTKNLIPVTLGNIIGGMVLVGIGYWLIYLRDATKKPAGTPHSNKKKRK